MRSQRLLLSQPLLQTKARGMFVTAFLLASVCSSLGISLCALMQCARTTAGGTEVLPRRPVSEQRGGWGGAAMLEVRMEELNMSDATVHITVRPNGPLRVEGHIVLKDADGREWDLTGKPAISLCRCGMSEKRPFCDGAHARNNFLCDTAPPGNLT
jgi:CDGSH-type Zn-finger protein